MASLDAESLFSNIPLKKQLIIVLVIFAIKVFTTENLTNLTCSNFWKQQPVNLLLFFDFLLYKQINGVVMASLWTHLLANAFLCHYKNEGWTFSHLILNLLYTEGLLMIFLFFSHLKNISILL